MKQWRKKAAIFDFDGVLVDSMPLHVQAWRSAFNDVAGISFSDRQIYLLEGMRGIELIRKLFELHHVTDGSLIGKVNDVKNSIFRSIKAGIRPFPGTTEALSSIRFKKAVVSGSSKQDVVPIVEQAFGVEQFEVILTADDVQNGKPDPSSFLEAQKRLCVEDAADSIVIENSPLGAAAAINAGIECVVVLNNTPLLRSDFEGIVAGDRILDSTALIRNVLGEMCQ